MGDATPLKARGLLVPVSSSLHLENDGYGASTSAPCSNPSLWIIQSVASPGPPLLLPSFLPALAVEHSTKPTTSLAQSHRRVPAHWHVHEPTPIQSPGTSDSDPVPRANPFTSPDHHRGFKL